MFEALTTVSVKPPFRYTLLKDFLALASDEVQRANLHAQGLQLEYLMQMAAHHAPASYYGLAEKLELDALNISFYFKEITPSFSLWQKFLIWIGTREKLPDGTYLILTNQNEQSLTFSIVLSSEAPDKLTIQPEPKEGINYYVVTKGE